MVQGQERVAMASFCGKCGSGRLHLKPYGQGRLREAPRARCGGWRLRGYVVGISVLDRLRNRGSHHTAERDLVGRAQRRAGASIRGGQWTGCSDPFGCRLRPSPPPSSLTVSDLRDRRWLGTAR